MRGHRRPITKPAIDRAVVALERLIEAPDFIRWFPSRASRVAIHGARETLLWAWRQEP